MKRYRYFAVVVTRRDFTEELAHIDRNETAARQVATATARLKGDGGYRFIRCLVRPVLLTAEDVAVLVEKWGRQDASTGEKRAGADELPEPWRTHYLTGYQGH